MSLIQIMPRPDDYHGQSLVFWVQVVFLLRIVPLFSTALYFLVSLVFCKLLRTKFSGVSSYSFEFVSRILHNYRVYRIGWIDETPGKVKEEIMYVAPYSHQSSAYRSLSISELTTEQEGGSDLPISSLYISGYASISENADDAFSEISDECDYFAYLQWHIVSIADITKVGLVIDVFSCGQIMNIPELTTEMSQRGNMIPDNLLFCVDILMDTSTFFHFPTRVFTHYVLDLVETIFRTNSIQQYEESYPVLTASEIERIFGITGIYDIPDATPIVLKTHWIRILQKKWRRWFAEKKRRLRIRGSLASQRQFELTGKYFPAASIYQTSINTKTD